MPNRFGPIRDIKNAGSLGWWGTCPVCKRIALLDEDQYHGRVSVECMCGYYHETHDHRPAALRADATTREGDAT